MFKNEQKYLTNTKIVTIIKMFKNEPNGVRDMKNSASMNYFDIMGVVKKSYNMILSPIYSKWEITRNELDVLLFLLNNPQ